MKCKSFFTMVCMNGVMGVKEQNGYREEIRDLKFNIYLEEISSGSIMVHIIDPHSGMAIYSYKSSAFIFRGEEMNLINKAIEEFKTKDALIASYKKRQKDKDYQLLKAAFTSYKKAYKIYQAHKQEKGLGSTVVIESQQDHLNFEDDFIYVDP